MSGSQKCSAEAADSPATVEALVAALAPSATPRLPNMVQRSVILISHRNVVGAGRSAGNCER